MKNIFELLSSLEIQIPEDKKSAFESAFNENYKTIAEVEKLRASRDNYKSQLDTAQNALKEFEGVDVKDKEIREQINYIFGNDVCTAAFGTTNCLSPAGGNLLYQNFLDALFPILEKDISAEKAKVEKNIKKYTSQVKK